MQNRQITFLNKNDLQVQQAFSSQVYQWNEEFYHSHGRQRLAFLHSYGCQQNVADGERLEGQLADMGFGFTKHREEADLILYNTCAVREHAEEKVFGNVGELKRLKRENPDLLVGLCGCMTQQEEVVRRIEKSYSFVDLIFGTHALHRLPELLHAVLLKKGRVVEITDTTDYIAEGLPVRRGKGYRAWVSIMYGCNHFCTYCIVPYVRGRERSRGSSAVLEEIRQVIKEGYRDITLLGQNVNSYGKDQPGELDFPALLREIEKIPGDFRIRFMTSHPKDATPALLEAMRDCSKVARHLHLPVQSGSDRILKRMNRGYTVEEYREIVRQGRNLMPDLTFTSDIIVGFPGETREDFLETLQLIGEVRYSALYTFIYSRRSGTRAASMEDPTPAETKSAWLRELLAMQDPIGRAVSQQMLGRPARVLAEEWEDGILSGKMDSNMTCRFPGLPKQVGQFVSVTPSKAVSWSFEGEISPS